MTNGQHNEGVWFGLFYFVLTLREIDSPFDHVKNPLDSLDPAALQQSKRVCPCADW
jgi:hypothetical protein